MKLSTQNGKLNRRDALGLLGVLGAGVIVGCGDSMATPADGLLSDGGAGGLVDALGMDVNSLSCIVTPALDQGPFFVDEKLNRSDLLAGETEAGVVAGTPLALKIGVYGVNGSACAPLSGAQVDIWHADVNGLYSDTATGFVQATDTTGKKFLRAYQVAGADGNVGFTTIYPGWYFTRTVHIHVKVRVFSAAGDKTFEATTQMFLDDAVTDRVFARGAYAAHGPRSIPKNTNDQIYNGTGVGRAIDTVGPPAGQARPGDMALATMSETMVGGMAGYLAAMNVGVVMG